MFQTVASLDLQYNIENGVKGKGLMKMIINAISEDWNKKSIK